MSLPAASLGRYRLLRPALGGTGQKRGFTLVEMIIAIAIATALGTLAVGASSTFYKSQQLRTVTDRLASNLRSAQARAVRSDADTSHGVHLVAGSITLFRGATYAGRVVAYDEITNYPTYITITGATDVIFAKHTAVPSFSGSLVVSNGIKSNTITVYANGVINR